MSLDAPDVHASNDVREPIASNDVREPISLHQAVFWQNDVGVMGMEKGHPSHFQPSLEISRFHFDRSERDLSEDS